MVQRDVRPALARTLSVGLVLLVLAGLWIPATRPPRPAGKIGAAARPALPDLATMLNDPVRHVRETTQKALRQIRPGAVERVGPGSS